MENPETEAEELKFNLSKPIINLLHEGKYFSEIEIFEKIFSDTVINMILERTNSAEKASGAWEDLTLLDFKSYLRVLLMMGIHRKPDFIMHLNIQDLWDNKLIKILLKLIVSSQ